MISEHSEQQFQESLFGAHANDLWIKRRLELAGIIKVLEELSNKSDDPIERRQLAIDWLRFIKFLQDECSGLNFSDDKQWSKLMLMMDISKKYNHRSVKFCELLKRRQLIEANAKKIRQLNESARLAQSISVSLTQLDSLLETCSIELIAPNSDDANIIDHFDDLSTNLCEKILESNRYLRNHCWTLINNLRSELDNELVAKLPQLASWRTKLEHYERAYGLVCDFLSNFKSLQEIIVRLRPLMISIDGSSKKNPGSGSEQVGKRSLAKPAHLQNFMNDCKSSFRKILQFNHKNLIHSLLSGHSTSTKVQATGQAAAKAKVDLPKRVLLCKCLLNDAKNDYCSEVFRADLLQNLERAGVCERDLNELMQNLRLEFGRFYFVNDLELLSIISLDSRLIIISSHDKTEHQAYCERLIKKLFNNSLCGFVLDADGRNVIGIRSPIGETIRLHESIEPVPLEKRVNIYSVEIVRILNELLRKLSKTLRCLFLDAHRSGGGHFNTGPPSGDICWSLPLQLMIALDQLRFTQRVESIRSRSQLIDLCSIYEQRLKQLQTTSNTRLESSSLHHLKRSAAISMSVHFVSTLSELIKTLVDHKQICLDLRGDWNWLKLARYCFHDTGENWHLEVRLASARFNYRFDLLPIEVRLEEQQNNVTRQQYKRLINTKTNEKCFLAASHALGLFRLGASPFGPAGGGKTETIKALGQLLGCQVIVHNCDESNDAGSLERLVWGLAHLGLWGCFDEFNRLAAGTLSVLSATIELVQAGLRQKRTTLELPDGRLKTLDEDSAIFITLNPVDSMGNYRGRRQLPANLRALFLPISMSTVQVARIVGELLLSISMPAEISAERVRELGTQLAEWLELMRLKSDQHSLDEPKTCEWDLRLIMVIFRRVKMLLTNAANNNNNNEIQPKQQLDIGHLLMESIRVELSPRLSSKSLSVLNESLSSVFEHEHFEKKELPYSDKPEQLIEQLETRPGVILLGPCRSGKTSAWRMAASRMGGRQKVDWFVLNPKSCDKFSLFGGIKEATNKWRDGLFTCLVRRALSMLGQSSDDSKHQVWLILDGSIDSNWVESLNSVLDDNQVFTLSSGERLSFQPHPKKCIKLIFETVHLKYASPATISRLGLILFEDCAGLSMQKSVHLQASELSLVNLSKHEGLRMLAMVDAKIQQYKNMNSGESSTTVISYNCFTQMTHKHLQQLLKRLPNTCNFLVLRSFDTIRPDQSDDEWATRSCVELLRFILNYGFYYDEDENFSRREMPKLTLLLSFSRPVIQDDDQSASDMIRLLNLAEKNEILSVSSEFEESISRRTEFEACPLEKLREILSSRELVPRLMVLECDKSLPIEEIPKLFSNTIGQDILKFTTVVQALRSLDILRKLVLNDVSSKHTSSRLLVLLDEIEFRMMDSKFRTDLMHYMNLCFILDYKHLSFVYIMKADSQNQDQEQQSLLMMLMNYGCKVLRIESHHDHDLERYLSDHLEAHKGYLNDDGTEIAWLTRKVQTLLHPLNEDNDGSLSRIFIRISFEMIKKAREKIILQTRQLSDALENLENFDTKIKQTKSLKEREESQLIERRQQVAEMVEKIQMQLRNSKEQQKQIEWFQGLQREKSQQIQAKSEIIERELKQVLPLVEESRQEIAKCLKDPKALNEIKSLRQPPKVIKDILDVLFILLGQSDTSWSFIKISLTKLSLRDEMNNYDFKRRLDESMLKRVNEEIETRQSSFTLEQAKRASQAVVPILKWIEAARAYGQMMLVRLRPLIGEKEKLESESEEIRSSMMDLERKQVEIDERIQNDQENVLKPLRLECEEWEQKSKRISAELDQAQQVRSNLTGQFERWHSKLRLFRLLGETRKLARFCLLGAYMTILYKNPLFEFENQQPTQLWEILEELLEFDRETVEDGQPTIWANLMNLCVDDQDECTTNNDENLIKFSTNKGEEQKILLDLVVSKLNLVYRIESGLVQLILVDTQTNNKLTKAQLRDSLGSRKILCDNSLRDLQIIKVPGLADHEQCRWLDSAKFATKSGEKVIVFDMQHFKSIFDPIWLELLDFYRSQQQQQQQGAKIKCILVASSQAVPKNLLGELCKLLPLRPIQSNLATRNESQSSSTLAEIENKLMDYLAEISEKSSSQEEVIILEEELTEKLRVTKEIEAQLMRRLALHCQSETNTSENELVKILGDLHQSSENLREKTDEIRAKLAIIQQKRHQYAPLAREAAKLYESIYFAGPKKAMRLFECSPFCSFTLKHFAEILSSSSLKTNISRAENGINLELILASSMRPLERAARDLFKRETADKVSSIVLDEAARRAANLKQGLLELVEQLSAQDKDKHCCRVAILMHDSKKASPQLEVDELFGQWKEANSSTASVSSYKKFYASNDEATKVNNNNNCFASSLHTELSKFFSASPCADETKDALATTTKRIYIKCACVTNAQLASKWLASEQARQLLQSPPPPSASESQQKNSPGIRHLLVLIGESEHSTQCPFDSDLLDLAHLRLWHDELALNLSNRFELFFNHLANTRNGSPSNNNKLRDNLQHAQLTYSLVLMHVVCQEMLITKLENFQWQISHYSFDFEQLLLASKILDQHFLEMSQQFEGSKANELRQDSFARHLETIVYGARLECEQDERTLGRLMDVFISDSRSASQIIDRFKRLSNKASLAELLSAD